MHRHPAARARHPRTIALLTAAALALNPLPAGAVNIIMSFSPGSTQNPAADPQGTQLRSLMTFVESYYEDIFEDNYTLTLTFYYAPNGDFAANTLADHELDTQAGTPNRETAGTIRVNNSITWFYDATPADNSEFNMAQTLWRDLTAAQRTGAYNGTGPTLFEAGFSGAGISGQAASRQDLLSTLFHEVGHALGMSAANSSTVTETNDGDYDFNPDYVAGQSLAARTAASNNIPHLATANPFALMRPGNAVGNRQLPSHTDLLSMVASSKFTGVDLPRKEFYGGFSWNTVSNWSGNRLPDTGDDVNVRSAGILSLGGTSFAANVLIDEGTWINSGTSRLVVGGATRILGGARFRAQTSGELETFDLTVGGAGSQVQMLGGVCDVDGTLTLGAGCVIEGDGAVQVGLKLVSNGAIRAGNNGTLSFTSGTPGAWKLDNPGTTLEAVNGNLWFTSTHDGDYNGTLTVGPGRSAGFAAAWTLGSAGTLVLNGSPSTATVNGTGVFTVKGALNITGAAVFDAPVVFVDGTHNLAAGRTLTLAGQATFAGGTLNEINGAGTLVQQSNITVNTPTIFDVTTFDWGNSTQTSVKSLTINSELVIHSTATGTAGNPFRGNIVLNSGRLTVDQLDGWSLPASTASPTFTPAGTLTMNHTGGVAPVLFGNPLALGGSLTVSGGPSTIFNDVTFGPSVLVTVNTGAALNLWGVVSFSGGSIGGLGRINQDEDITIVASTAVSVSTFDWGNSGSTPSSINAIIVNPGQTFTVNSTSTSNPNNEFRGTMNLSSGNLTVANMPWALPAATSLEGAGTLNLTNTGGGTPTVAGQTLTLSGGTINVTGAAAITAPITFSAGAVNVAIAADLLNLSNATTFAGGTYQGLGTLRLSGIATVTADTTLDVATLDLDGTTEVAGVHIVNAGRTWTINATSLESTPGDGFDGQLVVNSGTLAVNSPTPWPMQGTLQLNKTTLVTPVLTGSAVALSGTLTTSGGGFLQTRLHNAGGTVSVPTAGQAINVFGGFSSDPGSVLTKTGAGNLTVLGDQTHGAGSRVQVNGGWLVLGSDAGSPTTATLEVVVAGGAQAIFFSSEHLARLAVNSGGKASQGGEDAILFVRELSILGSGVVDLSTNDLIYDYIGPSPLADVANWLDSGRNGGSWDGPGGIHSSAAATDAQQIRTLGYAEASTLGVTRFSGQAVDQTTILVKYTYYGDSNLNGTIDSDDFALIDKGFALGLGGWVFGDYNLSGSVTPTDYMFIDRSFGLQSGALSPDFLAARQAQFGAEYVRSLVASVPEPTAVAPLAIAAGSSLVGRRRRRHA